MSSIPYDPPGFATDKLGRLNDDLTDATRATSRLLLDVYETALESIAGYQEYAASRADVEWIATAAKAQARFTRELMKRQVSVGRELLT